MNRPPLLRAPGLRRRPLAALAWAALALALPAAARADRVDVEVDGLDRGLRRNVELLLTLAQRADEDLPAGRIRALHAQAPEEIREALEPFGYYRPTVTGELVQEGKTWKAHYQVDPGAPIPVGEVDVEVLGPGSTDVGFQRAVRDFPLASGDTLVHSRYEDGKRALEERAAAAGYLDANFETAEVRVDLERYVADIVLHYRSGPRYRFGDVTFRQSVVDPDILKGYVTFRRGDPLDVDRLLEMQNALSDSPYFSRVEVVPRRDRAVGDVVPVDVGLVPAKPQRWTAGVGYGTDTGARGSLGVELRRINRRGHRGQGELVLSQVERSFTARYMVPGPYPRTDVLTYSLGLARFAPESSKTDTGLVGASLARSRGHWREVIGLTWRRETFEVGLDHGDSDLLTPEATWTRVKADDRLYPTNGFRLQGELRAAADGVLSSTGFAQARVEAKYVRALGAGVRALGRVRVGTLETNGFHRLPPTIRFFAGGDQSVRGYAYQALGPEDAAGNVIGGERLVEASVEVDWLFFEKFGRWGVAAFYDAGNAMRAVSDPLKTGAGAGIRWLSPVGLVRLDVAWALDEEGTPARIHLAIGPDL